MTSETTTRRTGRRSGPTRTREAILDAARRRFADRGYDATTIRSIAADAGVDPALVHHFFGTKEKLFAAALRFPAVPSDVAAALGSVPRRDLGATVVRILLGIWEDDRTRAQGMALLRSAITNEHAAGLLREFVTSTILPHIAALAGGDDATYRASLAGSQIIGLAVARYLLAIEPLASAAAEDVVAAVGPTVQRYLTGPLRPGPVSG